MAKKILVSNHSSNIDNINPQNGLEILSNKKIIQPSREKFWKMVAAIAIVLLIITNSFWYLNLNQKNETSNYLELVHMNSLTADYYQSIRENVGPQSPGWSRYSNLWQEDVEFCANLAKHDAGEIYWKVWDQHYYELTNSHAYVDAIKKMIQINDNIIKITESDSEVEKISKILSFVNEKITYKYDLIDKYFSPIETLSYGTGDCDDYSILVACLFELNGIKSAISFYKNEQNEGHALVLAHLHDLGEYHYYYYSDLTNKNLSPGKWIMIEPQRTIEEQYNSSWFEQWDIQVAVEL